MSVFQNTSVLLNKLYQNKSTTLTKDSSTKQILPQSPELNSQLLWDLGQIS